MLVGILLLSIVLQRPADVPFDEKERCSVLNTGSPDQYEFVRIYEVGTGEIVFQSPIKGGKTAPVYVRSKRIKIEHKWAGDVDYHSAIEVDCDKGNTIKI